MRIGEGVRDCLGQRRNGRKIVAEPFDLIGEIHLRPDREHLCPDPHRLPDARVDEARFPARVGPDQQDRIRRFDAGDGRVEIDRGQIGRVIGQPGLAALDQGRAQ